MPHRKGDPVLCMSANQKKVHEAYGSIPIWLNERGSLVCVYCNTGNEEGCHFSCMLAPVMDNMRADVSHLDAENVRNDIPVTHEEMADNFSKFCLSPDVQNLVSGEHLYNDFVDQHHIILLLQGLGPWLQIQSQRYAEVGGVHKQSTGRLALKCQRATCLFLRLQLEALSAEDTVILSNIIESAASNEASTSSRMQSVPKVLDLLSIVNAVKEMQKRDMSTPLDQLQSAPLAPDTPSPTLADVINSFSDISSPDEEPHRCRGQTKAGARCKLTADSVTRLHGRCAEAAQPLAEGEKYCSFHKDQELLF